MPGKDLNKPITSYQFIRTEFKVYYRVLSYNLFEHVSEIPEISKRKFFEAKEIYTKATKSLTPKNEHLTAETFYELQLLRDAINELAKELMISIILLDNITNTIRQKLDESMDVIKIFFYNIEILDTYTQGDIAKLIEFHDEMVRIATLPRTQQHTDDEKRGASAHTEKVKQLMGEVALPTLFSPTHTKPCVQLSSATAANTADKSSDSPKPS